MIVNDVLELRRVGRIEEAYASIRSLYAKNKEGETASAMFWIAVDVFRKRVEEHRLDEAQKILLALQRMLPLLSGNSYSDAISDCQSLLDPSIHRPDKSEHLKMGEWGEELAAAYLLEKGYVVLERDWRSGHRDIDIIARKNELIVFVEVKTRRNDEYVSPQLAVDKNKQRNLLLAINHYIKSRRINNPFRFDVITVIGSFGCINPQIEHIENFHLSYAPIHKRKWGW